MMIYSALLLWLLAFVFPIGLYPFQDFARGGVTVGAALLLFSYLFSKRSEVVYCPRIFVFLPLGLLGLLGSYHFTSPSISISYNSYLVVLLACGWISLSAAELRSIYGKEFVVGRFASFLLLASMLCGLVGLLRYYGVLRHVIPLIAEDGDRLLGSLGQPNLTAVLLAIGFSALVFLKYQTSLIKGSWYYGALLFLIYCGTLTGSRTWFVVMFAVFLVWGAHCFKFCSDSNNGNARLQQRFWPSLLISFCLFLGAIWGAPVFDNLVSKHLIDTGYVNRVSAETMYKQREMVGSSGRVAEWRKVQSINVTSNEFWVGYGAGRYGVFSNEVAVKKHLQGNGAIWNNAHNIFINFFIEFGVVGMLFILACCLYIARMVFRAEMSVTNSFLVSIIGVLGLHSLVEFSLWSLPFLSVFVISVSLLDKSFLIKFSDFKVKRGIVVLCLIVFLPLGGYVGRDALTVIGIMYKQNPDSNDRFALDDVRRSSIIGDKAASVLILKFQPPISGMSNALAQMRKLADWRPEPLFVLRKSSLLAATGQYEEACLAITHMIKLYPITIEPLQKELDYYSDQTSLDSDVYYKCIFLGVGSWLGAPALSL
ncbi:PglL family O-oligosaccharyltransferase [Marinobacter sediminicola]|uniref:PglL family O-oligosaccharyltransferase n=1 Tax=Marinobacter sediminicola TaxID=3072994 RepID=UPI00281137E8|nr:Wzy polymerase domain-containing protein [Marinobacter sp. F26243]